MDIIYLLIATAVVLCALVAFILLAPIDRVRSRIYLGDATKNLTGHGWESEYYIDAYVWIGGRWRPARFTREDIERKGGPLDRGEKQAAEVMPRARWWMFWLGLR